MGGASITPAPKRVVFVHEGTSGSSTRDQYALVIRAFQRTLAANTVAAMDLATLESTDARVRCERGLVDTLVYVSVERMAEAIRVKTMCPHVRVIVLTAADPGEEGVIVANKLWKLGSDGWTSVLMGE